MEGTVATDGMTLDADIGLRLKAGGKVVSKSFTLLDNYYSLWKYQRPDYHGYDMVIYEACAWGDYVAGEVRSIVPGDRPGVMDTVPYRGDLKVSVSHPGGAGNEYSAITDADGVFIAKAVPLKKGDKVMIKLPGVPNPSSTVDATIPFREIKLYSADYFAGQAEGSVAGSRSKWARLAAASQGSPSAAAAAVIGNSNADRFRGVIPQQEAIKRMNEFRSNLTVYHGPVEFITSSAPEVRLRGGSYQLPGAQGTAPKSTAEQSQAARAASTRAVSGRATINQPAGVPANIPSSAPKITANRGTVNSPLGTFMVTGLTFEPGQKVKAQAIIEGFTVESEWVETEGLIVSAIENEDLNVSIRPGSETVAAQNSFVVVSSVHGETAPSGTVKMVRGADAPHASLTGPQPVPEFPEAKKARVWFSMSVPLTPLEDNPGAAIASTGPWSVTYSYSSPGDALIPAKNRKHPFEMVTYVYKNRDLGYSSFIDECASCTSPVNLVDKIENMPQPGMPGKPEGPSMQQKVTVPARQQQVTRPTVIR